MSSPVQRDVEAALFGSPLGVVDMIVGLVLLVVGLVGTAGAVVSRNKNPKRGRHRG